LFGSIENISDSFADDSQIISAISSLPESEGEVESREVVLVINSVNVLFCLFPMRRYKR
jgi:hypothetical protein